MFAFTAIVAYLIIGIGFVRLETEADVTFSIINPISDLVSTSTIDVLEPEVIQAPHAPIIPQQKPSVKPIAKRYTVPFLESKRYTLPFGEVVELRPVFSESTFPKMVELMDKIWNAGEENVIKDEIKLAQAANLKQDHEQKATLDEKIISENIESNAKEEVATGEVESIEKSEFIADEVKIEELVAYDYSPKAMKQTMPQNTMAQSTNVGSVLDSQIEKSSEL
jgi:hypothetical protein